MLRSTISSGALVGTAFLSMSPFLVAGCSALGKPSQSTTSVASTSAKAPEIDASKILAPEQLNKYRQGTPQRATLEFIRALQIRDWFDAYYRLSDPALRKQITFTRFSEIGSAVYPRTFLPFTIRNV